MKKVLVERLKIGVIGTGNISDVYLKNCLGIFCNLLEVKSCSSLHPEKARAKAETFHVPAVSVDEILADPEIDTILNLTPPGAHADINLAALEHGKNVYSEKPLVVRREDGFKIVMLAAEKRLRVGCAPDTFLGGGLQTCRKLIDDGWIGTPFAANGMMLKAGPERHHPNPDFFYQTGGGPLFDMGPYYLSVLIALLGPIKRLAGMAKTTYPYRTITAPQRYGQQIKVETPTHIVSSLEFYSGVLGTLTTSFDLHFPYKESGLPLLQIFGSEGTLTVPDPNYFDGPVLLRSFGGEFKEIPLTHGFTANYRGLGLAEMAVSIHRGRPHRASGEIAAHVLDVMYGVLESSRNGRFYDTVSSCLRPEPLPAGLPVNALE
jgi:predicted dehydrogenase